MNPRELVLLLVSMTAAACTVDRENPKYDELRYDELQKARCSEIATVLSKPLLSEETEDYDLNLKRCQDMKTLSLEEYKVLADYARQHGVWDLYAVFPDKFEAPVLPPIDADADNNSLK